MGWGNGGWELELEGEVWVDWLQEMGWDQEKGESYLWGAHFKVWEKPGKAPGTHKDNSS